MGSVTVTKMCALLIDRLGPVLALLLLAVGLT